MSSPDVFPLTDFSEKLGQIQRLPQLRSAVVAIMSSSDDQPVSAPFSADDCTRAYQCLIDSQLMTQEMFIHFSMKCIDGYSDKLDRSGSEDNKIQAFNVAVRKITQQAHRDSDYTAAIKSLRNYCKPGFTSSRRYEAFFAALPVKELLQLSKAQAELARLEQTQLEIERAVFDLKGDIEDKSARVSELQEEIYKLLKAKEKEDEIAELKRSVEALYQSIFPGQVERIFGELEHVTSWTSLMAFLRASQKKVLCKSSFFSTVTPEIESVRMACMMASALSDNRSTLSEQDYVLLDDEETDRFRQSNNSNSGRNSRGRSLVARCLGSICSFFSSSRSDDAESGARRASFSFRMAIKPKKRSWSWRSPMKALSTLIAQFPWWLDRSSRHQQRKTKVTKIVTQSHSRREQQISQYRAQIEAKNKDIVDLKGQLQRDSREIAGLTTLKDQLSEAGSCSPATLLPRAAGRASPACAAVQCGVFALGSRGDDESPLLGASRAASPGGV